MTLVPPDGHLPCDLAVVGEAPGKAEEAEGRGFVGPSGRILWAKDGEGLDLMNVIAERPRESCYVTNVCKEPLPDADWWRLSLAERDIHVGALLRELEPVQPKVVLAFGRRASMALVPGFNTMPADHGKPTLGPGGRFIAMALWHPAAYLRGNGEALGAIATDLAKVGALLSTEGLIELMRPPPQPEAQWADRIGFLFFEGTRKSGKCMYCKITPVGAYAGEELKWLLCQKHAESAAVWAEDNVEALYEHRAEAMRVAEAKRQDRVAAKMKAELLGKKAS